MILHDLDPFLTKWLKKLWPSATVYRGDIKALSSRWLSGQERVHLFAGIGGWELALKLAGWPDGRPVWTGSCPCQPFAHFGKRKGNEDERHLWPEFLRLIKQCRPSTIFGEQVASNLGREWLAGVRADLEALGYAVGAADLCAASAGAPHERARLWWVASLRMEDPQGVGWVPPPANGKAHQDRPANSDTGVARQLQIGPVRSSWIDRWRASRSVRCRDGFERRAEPGVCTVVDGFPGSMEQSRAYGNSIVPQVAAKFIRAFLEAEAAFLRDVVEATGFGPRQIEAEVDDEP